VLAFLLFFVEKESFINSFARDCTSFTKEVDTQMVKKRGQAALEFLSTYGFAFLIILVMVGALTYFGVLNPSRLVPDACLTSPEIRCNDYQMQAGGTLTVVLVNNGGKTVTLTGGRAEITSVAQTDPAALCQVSLDNIAYGVSQQVSPGQLAYVQCVVTNAHPGPGGPGTAVLPGAGEKVKAFIDLTLLETGGTFAKPSTIEVRTTLV
jgi:uncharacterized protein (UPF0333 family)